MDEAHRRGCGPQQWLLLVPWLPVAVASAVALGRSSGCCWCRGFPWLAWEYGGLRGGGRSARRAGGGRAAWQRHYGSSSSALAGMSWEKPRVRRAARGMPTKQALCQMRRESDCVT